MGYQFEREQGEAPDNRARGFGVGHSRMEPQAGVEREMYKLEDGSLISITADNFGQILQQDEATIALIAERQVLHGIAQQGHIWQISTGQYFQLVYDMGYRWQPAQPFQAGLFGNVGPTVVHYQAQAPQIPKQRSFWELGATGTEG